MNNLQLNCPYSLLKDNADGEYNLWFDANTCEVHLKNDGAIISTIDISQHVLGITVSGSDLLFVDPLEPVDIQYTTKVNIYNSLQISVDLFNMMENGIKAYSLFIGIEDMRTFRFIHAFNLDTRILNLQVLAGELIIECA